jgi:hypothetical protein
MKIQAAEPERFCNAACSESSAAADNADTAFRTEQPHTGTWLAAHGRSGPGTIRSPHGE